MESIKKWLSTPYYFNPSSWFKLKTSFILAISLFCFLYVFRPFTISFLEEKYVFEYTFGISLTVFLGSSYMLFVPPLLFKDYFDEDHWTIGKNILLLFISLFINGTILWYLVCIYRTNLGLEPIKYPVFLAYTYLSGAFPIFLIIVINEKKARLKREKKAEVISELTNLKPKEVFEKKVIIYADNQKEFLKISIDNLVYITSQGNYASFFSIKNNDLKEEILRVTLTKVMNELSDYKTIIRCHKSYIINSKYIKKISGNARGYLIDTDILPFQIPVSRSFSKESLEKLI